MHELLLYGQVSRSRHEQVLKILAGVAAMQPRRVLQRHIVYKPQREPEEPGAHLRRGGTQNVGVGGKITKQAAAKELYFTRLVQQLSEEDFPRENEQQQPQEQALNASRDSGAGSRWSFEFHDVPDTGDRGVLVRLANSTDILGGDPHAYMVSLGNGFVSEYYVEGHQYVHENVVIFLHRALHEPGVRSLEVAPRETLPAFESLRPLDPSEAYLLEAKIRVQDLNNPALLEAGVDELKKFKAQMKGCVELTVPERLTLDTRVKWKPKTAPPVRQVPVGAR